MNKNSFVHYLTKIIVDVMFYGGFLCCAALPFTIQVLVNFFDYTKIPVIPLTIFLISTGICALYILWQLKLMFKTLVGGNPFINKNVNCLRKCSVSSFLISIIYIAKIVFLAYSSGVCNSNNIFSFKSFLLNFEGYF